MSPTLAMLAAAAAKTKAAKKAARSAKPKKPRKVRSDYTSTKRRALGFGKPRGPLRLVLFCPHCKAQHVDRGQWAVLPHHTHDCGTCFQEFRPTRRCSYGVEG